MNPGFKTGRAVAANAGLRDRYRRMLTDLAGEMHKSAAYWILAEYKRQQPRAAALLATDASPARTMIEALRAQSARWRKQMDEKAEEYALWFAARANSAATAATKQSLTAVAGFTVGMQMSRTVNNTLQAVIAENVSLIRSIGDVYFRDVERAVLTSVQRGRDVAGLADELEKIASVSRDKAVLIAVDQNQKATSEISRARMADSGCVYGRWRSSRRARHPRQSHQEADGEIFPLAEGLMIDGKLTFPGMEINCGCRTEPVVPGYERKMIDWAKEGRENPYLKEWQARREERKNG